MVGLTGDDLAIARLAIVLAKSPSQVDETLAEQEVVRDGLTSEQLDRLLDPTGYVGMSVKFAEQGAAKARETADALEKLEGSQAVELP